MTLSKYLKKRGFSKSEINEALVYIEWNIPLYERLEEAYWEWINQESIKKEE